MCEHGLMSCYTQKLSPPPLSVNKWQTLTPAGTQCLLPVFFFKAQGNDCHLRWNSPLRDEIYKLWGETVSRQLWRRFIHHLFELLEGSSPWVVGKFQNGQFNLGRKERRIQQILYSLQLNFMITCCMYWFTFMFAETQHILQNFFLQNLNFAQLETFITLTGHFIMYTCSIAHQYKYLIS